MRLILYKNYLLHFNGEFHIHYKLTCNNFQRDIIEYYQKKYKFQIPILCIWKIYYNKWYCKMLYSLDQEYLDLKQSPYIY